MATVLTLDELTTLLASEPTTAKTRAITLARMANVDTIVNANEPTVLDVTDEHKADGSEYTRASILQAYRAIVKKQECGDKVAIRELKRAGRVVIGTPSLLHA